MPWTDRVFSVAGSVPLWYKENMNADRNRVFVILAALVLLVNVPACFSLSSRLPGYPEGSVSARRAVKKLAIVGFLVHYNLGPEVNLATVFNPDAWRQQTVEYAFAAFAAELKRSRHFKILPPSAVRANRYYKKMKIDPDPRKLLRATSPACLRRLSASNNFDYRRLCRALGVDGLILLEFSYSMHSGLFLRSARIISASLTSLDKDGYILYKRERFALSSGGKYFKEYTWLRMRSPKHDKYCLGIAVRAIARDFILTFAPR